MAAYDITEMMVIAASKVLEDKKMVFVGTGMPLAAAALAKKTHAPNLTLVFEAGGLGPELPRIPISVGESITFYRGIEAAGMDNVMGAAARGLIDYGFLGGAQIDRYGNLNTTIIGAYDRPKARFPGSGGANDIGSLCWQTIMIMRHDKQRFVEKLDFLTTPGYLSGPGAREKAGLPKNTGPYRVVTTLGMLGFDEVSKRMKLLAVNPGVSVQDVIDNTGFDLLIADKVQEIKPPTDEELRILREEVDPVGTLLAKSK
jgi:glutaconate CoA-transferase, subunit B